MFCRIHGQIMKTRRSNLANIGNMFKLCLYSCKCSSFYDGQDEVGPGAGVDFNQQCKKVREIWNALHSIRVNLPNGKKYL